MQMPEQFISPNPENLNKAELLSFNGGTGNFETVPDIALVTTLDLIFNAPTPESTQPIFADVKMYDIPRTVIRALEQLASRFPDCYATIFGSPDMLEECATADTGVKLIAVTTLPPGEVDDVELWKHEYGAAALEAGCNGLLVDFDCNRLAEQYPEKQFFMTRAL